MCAWEGAKEVVAWVGERVELECLVKASPPSVTFAWKSVTFTPNMEQVSESNVRVREMVEESVCGIGRSGVGRVRRRLGERKGWL